MPWVADGINSTESGVVQELLYIAVTSPSAVSSIVEIEWVRDGVDKQEAEAIAWVDNSGDADVALSVTELGWVRDGIEELEVKTIQELSYIGQDDAEVATEVIALPWVQDGIEDLEFQAINWINHFGAGKVMASVVELGWVQDSIDELEAKAIEDLSDINYYDSTVAASVVALPWVQDGILELEGDTLPVLDYMNYINAPLATYVVALPWVQDGIEAIERETLNWLNNEQWGQTVHHVAELSWVQDNIDEVERDAISNLYYLTTHDASITETVVAFDWVQDGVDKLEDSAINDLRWIANGDAVLAQTVVAFDWVQDGLDIIEGDAIDNLYRISADDVVLAQSVVDLHWVRDGVTTLENSALNQLAWFTEDTSPASKALVALPWVQDGVTAIEVDTIDWLNAFSEPGTALQIVSMPFLETLEPADSKAVEALGQMALWEEAQFQRVMAHPTLQDGITDYWAKIVTTLYTVAKFDAPAIDQLLDPDQVSIEERTIELPLGGETLLVVIRTSPGSELSMGVLEQAVRYTEQVVNTAFPSRYVALLFGESLSSEAAGNYNGTHITVLSEYDIYDNTQETEYVAGTITHETAHYFWHGYHAWLNEGLANATESIIRSRIKGILVEPDNAPCVYMNTISALVEHPDALDRDSDQWLCNYSLAERLFMDLYRTLGGDQFSAGLRALYGSLVDPADEETTEIEHVEASFNDILGVDASLVADVISRWYDGVTPYDISGIDTTTPNPRFRSVNGRIDVAYLSTAVDGVPTTTFSASPADDREVWLFLDYSYNVPRTQDVPLELVTYYADGFAFKRREVAFDAQPQWGGGSWWLFVGAPKDDQWAEGTYWVHVYNEGRKLVELEYEVTP